MGRGLVGWLAAASLVTLTACAGATPDDPADSLSTTDLGAPADDVSQTQAVERPDGVEGVVAHVDDGDSLVVSIDGQRERVRLIGVNAPEQDECLADVARQALVEAVAGETVLLEPDVQDVDEFGRLLRYVWLDSTLINESLTEQGLAIAREYAPNTARQASLDAAQQRARDDGLGMWSVGACGNTPTVEIAILAIQSDQAGPNKDNLNGEFVVFENLSDAAADLSGFVLRDGSSSNRFAFPDFFAVPDGGRFVVYVGCGDNTEAELFWCHDGPVWNNDGDEVFLTDAAGNIVAYDSY